MNFSSAATRIERKRCADSLEILRILVSFERDHACKCIVILHMQANIDDAFSRLQEIVDEAAVEPKERSQWTGKSDCLNKRGRHAKPRQNCSDTTYPTNRT